MADHCPTCGTRKLDVVYVGSAEATIRSLRAKLMMERAELHELRANALDYCATERAIAAAIVFRARARRLRAKAERVERGP